ncbi:alpha/beta hydrolase [Sphingosinicella sp. CPCC 101087]|uniref:alpha/beta hydrolase n=1 Tax=Sphingosinicella sp. CPCC 101087 TaxID=2497754 RepID=UPI00101C9221|nr:alpha/beta hydrolase-fold protein [Sphingosinicella sp. CPCC 101087]
MIPAVSRLAALLLLLGAALLHIAPASAQSTGRLHQYRDFPSMHVAPRNVTVWLPPGYEPKGQPHAVLYMHDGQNLFEGRTGYGGQEWRVDEAAARLIAKGAIRPTIIVGIWNTPQRLREYVPAKALERLPSAYLERVRGLYGGDALSEAYLSFIVRELKPFIDRSYNVARDQANTAIMGSSMGGLISLYALTEYPEVFGAAGALSTHWPLLLPPDGESLSGADVDAVATAFEAYLRPALPRPGRHRLYFDHGSETLDRHYAPYQARIDRLVAAAGWSRDRDWISRSFPGAAHDEQAWRARVHIPLRFLLPPIQGSSSRAHRPSGGTSLDA